MEEIHQAWKETILFTQLQGTKLQEMTTIKTMKRENYVELYWLIP